MEYDVENYLIPKILLQNIYLTTEIKMLTQRGGGDF